MNKLELNELSLLMCGFKIFIHDIKMHYPLVTVDFYPVINANTPDYRLFSKFATCQRLKQVCLNQQQAVAFETLTLSFCSLGGVLFR